MLPCWGHTCFVPCQEHLHPCPVLLSNHERIFYEADGSGRAWFKPSHAGWMRWRRHGCCQSEEAADNRSEALANQAEAVSDQADNAIGPAAEALENRADALENRSEAVDESNENGVVDEAQ